MSDPLRSQEPLWRARGAHDLVWAELGGDYVVYHRPSGKTHFFNTATAALLTKVLLEPRSAVAAAEELAEREDAVGDEAFFVAVAQSLERLEHLGLVERV